MTQLAPTNTAAPALHTATDFFPSLTQAKAARREYLNRERPR